MRSAEWQRDVDRRFDLPFTLRIPHSTFRITMSVQAIAWSPTGAVRIIDQRALPETRIERDLDSAEAVAAAIRTLQVRGAPLIGIAAAMGLVAGTRELRGAPREPFLARMHQLAELLGAARRWGGRLGASSGGSDSHLGGRPRHVPAHRRGRAAARPRRGEGADPLQRRGARHGRDRDGARADLSRA